VSHNLAQSGFSLIKNRKINHLYKKRNSCPICRFELETDDPDYESRKKQTN